MSEKKVAKMLSPEERTVIANIESLVKQLRQMDEGEGGEDEGSVEPDDVLDTQKSVQKGEDSMDINALKKKLMNGESLEDEERLTVLEVLGNGGGFGEEEKAVPEDEDNYGDHKVDEPEDLEKATASDSAEDRAGDNQEDTTSEASDEAGDNMKQIVRSVIEEVNKSVDSKLKDVKKTSEDNANALHALLDGMGLLQEVEKSVEGEKDQKVEKSSDNQGVQKNRPVVNMSMDDLKEMFGVEKGQDSGGESDGGLVEPFEVRKSSSTPQNRSQMAEAMGALFGVNNDKNGRF